MIKYEVNQSPVFMIFFMEFINIGPVYIRGWVGWGEWWQKLKQRRKKTQIVEFRVAMTCTCTHKGPILHYKAWTDMLILVGAISGPNSQPGALLWRHFTSRGFTWSAKSIQGKQTSRH